MNRLEQIPQASVYAAWEEAEEFLGKAVASAQRAEALEHLKHRCLNGLNQLWKVKDDKGETVAWGTTTLYTPDGVNNYMQIDTASATDLTPLLERMDEFESWAISKNVHYIEVIGRLGWTRVLKSKGFIHNYTSSIKPVVKELH